MSERGLPGPPVGRAGFGRLREEIDMAIGVTNWSGNHAYRATRLHRPTSLDELRAVVAHTPKIHALGSRHCFNDIADSAELVALDGMPQDIEIDRAAGVATIPAGMLY